VARSEVGRTQENMDGEPGWWSPEDWNAFQERVTLDSIVCDPIPDPPFEIPDYLSCAADDDPFLIRAMDAEVGPQLKTSETLPSELKTPASSPAQPSMSLARPPLTGSKRLRTLPVLPALLQAGNEEFYRLTRMKPPCDAYHVESLMDVGPTLFAHHREAQMLISNWKFYRGRMLNQWTFNEYEDYELTRSTYERLALDVHQKMMASLQLLRETAAAIHQLHEFLGDPVQFSKTGKSRNKFTPKKSSK
jgi:hypothetical protein